MTPLLCVLLAQVLATACCRSPDHLLLFLQITGKKVALFNRPLHAPTALDEVALTAESLAVNQAPALLSRLSLNGTHGMFLPEEMPRQASDPITINISRKSS